MKASDCSLNPSNHCPLTQLVSHVIQCIVLLLHLLALHPVDDDVGLVVSSATLRGHLYNITSNESNFLYSPFWYINHCVFLLICLRYLNLKQSKTPNIEVAATRLTRVPTVPLSTSVIIPRSSQAFTPVLYPDVKLKKTFQIPSNKFWINLST